MTPLRAGGLCLCIKTFDAAHARQFEMNVPAVGAIVTVLDVTQSVTGDVIVRLEEFRNDHLVGRTVNTARFGIVTIDTEPGLPAEHFRPLDDARLDQFRLHLGVDDPVLA